MGFQIVVGFCGLADLSGPVWTCSLVWACVRLQTGVGLFRLAAWCALKNCVVLCVLEDRCVPVWSCRLVFACVVLQTGVDLGTSVGLQNSADLQNIVGYFGLVWAWVIFHTFVDMQNGVFLRGLPDFSGLPDLCLLAA